MSLNLIRVGCGRSRPGIGSNTQREAFQHTLRPQQYEMVLYKSISLHTHFRPRPDWGVVLALARVSVCARRRRASVCHVHQVAVVWDGVSDYTPYPRAKNVALCRTGRLLTRCATTAGAPAAQAARLVARTVVDPRTPSTTPNTSPPSFQDL